MDAIKIIDIQMDAIEWDRNVGHVLPAFGCLIFPFSMLQTALTSKAWTLLLFIIIRKA